MTPDSAAVSAPDILTRALDLYRTHAKAFLIAAAIALGPIYLLHAALSAALIPASAMSSNMEDRSARIQARSQAMQRGGMTAEDVSAIQAENIRDATAAMAEAGGAMAGIGLFLLSLVLLVPLTLIGTFFATAALVPMVNDRAAGGNMTPGGAWARVGERAVPLIITSVLAAIAVAVGLIFFVLPGLILGFLFALAAPVVMLDDLAGVAALKRSAKLVMANLFAVVVVILALALLCAIARFIGGLFIPSRFVFLHTLISDAVSLVVFPLPVIGLVLLHRGTRHAPELSTPAMQHPLASP
jgi:hypothetical protein